MAGLIGQKVDRYEILEMIGVGGMATVYKAFDTRLDREVAIKFIKREAFPPEQLEMILKRFEREAKSLGRLSHPNIVGVIDYGEYDGAPYLVMTYLPGGTLKQKLGKPIPWREAVETIIPIARALQYIHSHNIINRDVKPSNILLTENDQAMLTDFGLVKLFEGQDTAQQLTASGAGIGTPDYMAPEQWTGEATSLSDMYSLGVVLYEMITGRRPYISDTPAGILLKQVNEPLPLPNKYIPDLPQNIEAVLLKVLARKPEDRYANMNAFANDLQSILAGGQATATAVGTEKLREQMTGTVNKQDVERVREKIEQAQKEKAQPIPHPAPPAKKKQMLPIFVIVIIGAFSLLVLCGGCWLVYSISQPTAATPTVLAFTSPTAPPIVRPTGTLPAVAAPLPTPQPQPQTGEFDLLLQKFEDKGYINTTEGETIPIDPFKEEWAQLNYYQWWTIDQQASDLVFSGHFKWSSSNSTPDLSGCGVIFGLQDNDDHYAVFLDKGRIAFFMSRGANVYEVGRTRGPGRVNFSNPAEADFALVVKGGNAYVSVDGEVTEYTLSQDQSTSGGFALTVLSGTNSGYGTRCEMTDMFLFRPK